MGFPQKSFQRKDHLGFLPFTSPLFLIAYKSSCTKSPLNEYFHLLRNEELKKAGNPWLCMLKHAFKWWNAPFRMISSHRGIYTNKYMYMYVHVSMYVYRSSVPNGQVKLTCSNRNFCGTTCMTPVNPHVHVKRLRKMRVHLYICVFQCAYTTRTRAAEFIMSCKREK